MLAGINSRWINLIIVAVLLVITSNLNWHKNHWQSVIVSDGKGYYAYLPAVFIYHDLNFGFHEAIEEKYYPKETAGDYRSELNGKKFTKYPVGVAIMLSPFFILAHWLTSLTGGPADGYSFYYPISVTIAVIAYLFIALVYLRKLLQSFRIEDYIISLTLIGFVFGTNIFYYAVAEQAMSHIYAFTMITIFIYYTRSYLKSQQLKHFFLCVISLGLVILIRPVNIIILGIIPFISRDTAVIKKTATNLLQQKKRVLIGVILLFTILFIQLLLYQLQTGKFIIDPYGGEHFIWTKPEFLNILFSYKKGLFIYTPIILVSLTGLFFLYRENKFRFYSFLLFFTILTYVLSSWWCWYYGGSFGLRAYIDFYSIFAILFAIALAKMKKKIYRYSFISIVILLIIVCQMQTYQYRYYHIHWSEMTKEKYWQVFMRIDKLIK